MKCYDCGSLVLRRLHGPEKEGWIFLCHWCWYKRHEQEFTIIICGEADILEGSMGEVADSDG